MAIDAVTDVEIALDAVSSDVLRRDSEVVDAGRPMCKRIMETPLEETEEYRAFVAMLHRRMILGLDRLQVERLDALPYEVAKKCYEVLTSDDTSRRRLEHDKATGLVTVYLDLNGDGHWLAFVTSTMDEVRDLGARVEQPKPAHHTMS